MTKLNKTSMFLLPTVLVNKDKKEFPIKNLINMGFVNSYIDDLELIKYEYKWYESTDYHLYLQFKPKDKLIFSTTEEIFKNFDNWVDYYDLEDGSIIHVFKIPKRFEKDFNKFRDGRYSEFSKELKERYRMALILGIVNKIESTRQQMSREYGIEIPINQEYMSRPLDSEEIFRYETVTIN